MRDAKSDLSALGAKLRIVGNGAPHFAKAFGEDHDLHGDVFTDPERNVYRALGMVRGRSSTFNLKSIGAGVRAFRGGHRQQKVKGDPIQQGGVIVVGSNDRILMLYLSKHAGDHPPMTAVFDAVRAAGEH